MYILYINKISSCNECNETSGDRCFDYYYLERKLFVSNFCLRKIYIYLYVFVPLKSTNNNLMLQLTWEKHTLIYIKKKIDRYNNNECSVLNVSPGQNTVPQKYLANNIIRLYIVHLNYYFKLVHSQRSYTPSYTMCKTQPGPHKWGGGIRRTNGTGDRTFESQVK